MANERATASDVLEAEIRDRLEEFTKKRRRDKGKAFGLKIGAAALGALITTLLGLNYPAHESELKNAALVAGALVGLLNAWDAFYDHRELWVKRTVTVSRLKKLKRSVRLARAESHTLSKHAIADFKAELDRITDDDVTSWVQLRADQSEKKEKSAALLENEKTVEKTEKPPVPEKREMVDG